MDTQNIFSQPIDRGALTLARSIALQESSNNGNTPNYNIVGDAGTSKGAYQWQPGNFEAGAKSLGLNPSDFSPQNQDKVAYGQVLQYKKRGFSPDQIAAAWNAGEGKALSGAWKNNVGTTTINGKQIAYNTPRYVQEVNKYYQQLSGSQGQQQGNGYVNTPPYTPPPTSTTGDQSVLGQNNQSSSQGGGILGSIANGIGGFLKSATEPVATMLARPYQLGHELLGGETDEDKLADVPGLSSIYGKFPVPGSAADVEKDVGRGIQTAAFGLGPVAGGAAFGLGGSLESGNPLLSTNTALSTAGGAALGKVAEVAAPVISKVAGAVTPKFIKDVGSKLGEAVSPVVKGISDFADNTKILPDFASNAINSGADAVNNLPSRFANVIKGQYGITPAGNSTEALQAQVETDLQKALGVTGKKSAGVSANVGSNMRKGVETLYDESPNLTVNDESGLKIPYDPTTASMSQHVQALDQAKQNIYKELEGHINSATQGGVTVDTTDTQNKLRAIIDDVGQPQEMQTRAAQLLAKIKQLQTPSQVNTYLQGLNKGLGATFKGTSESISHQADVTATQELNKALDQTVIDIGEDPTIKVGGRTLTAADIHKIAPDSPFIKSLSPEEQKALAQFDSNGSVKAMLDNAIASHAPQDEIDMFQNRYNQIKSESGKETNPIRILKNKYSSLKAIENNLVNKAQQMARKTSGGLGGGLNDYINAFNLADAFDLITNPIGAAKAGVRAAILSKLSANKNPENLFQDAFKKIQLYKNLQQNIKPPGAGILSNLLKNTATGGIIGSIRNSLNQ